MTYELTPEEIPLWLGGNYFRECADEDGVIPKYRLPVDKPSFDAGYQYAVAKLLALIPDDKTLEGEIAEELWRLDGNTGDWKSGIETAWRCVVDEYFRKAVKISAIIKLRLLNINQEQLTEG